MIGGLAESTRLPAEEAKEETRGTVVAWLQAAILLTQREELDVEGLFEVCAYGYLAGG